MKNEIEVLAFRKVSNSSDMDLADRFTSQQINVAMEIANQWSKCYYRVVVYDSFVDEDGFVEGDELIACWEDGDKTL